MTSQSQPPVPNRSAKRPPYLTGKAIEKVLHDGDIQAEIYRMDTYLITVVATCPDRNAEECVLVSVGEETIELSLVSPRREFAFRKLSLSDPDSERKVPLYIEEWLRPVAQPTSTGSEASAHEQKN